MDSTYPVDILSEESYKIPTFFIQSEFDAVVPANMLGSGKDMFEKCLIRILNEYEKNRDRLNAGYFCKLETPEPPTWREGSVNGHLSL